MAVVVVVGSSPPQPPKSWLSLVLLLALVMLVRFLRLYYTGTIASQNVLSNRTQDSKRPESFLLVYNACSLGESWALELACDVQVPEARHFTRKSASLDITRPRSARSRISALGSVLSGEAGVGAHGKNRGWRLHCL